MDDGPLGVTFRETMAGGFALGVDDPRAGLAAGRAAGEELAMHARVRIDDLDRFVADPEHRGELTGTIDFPPLGHGLPATGGNFQLFFPVGEPATKRMIYELAFEHQGEPRYLAGYKVVRDDPGFDLWSDTTTLYTRLHAGSDTTGEVLGAGVLGLGVGELIKLVASMRPEGTRDPVASAAVLAKFGRFFLGELWTTYARHSQQ